MSKHLKNIGIVSFLTMLSRVLGVVRESLTARVFESSLLSSAFVTAFRLPNLFRRLLAEGSLTAAFVPVLQEEIRDNGRAGAFALFNNVATWLALVTSLVVVGAALVFAPFGVAPAGDEKWRLATGLTVVLFPYLIFVCLAAAFSAALQVLGRFTEAALSPIWLNVAMIGTLGVAGWIMHGKALMASADVPTAAATTAIHWLCAGALVGGFFQMAVPAWGLFREGWRPKPNLALSPRVRAIALLMVPGVFGTAIYQVNQYVNQLLAYGLSNSAAADINYASRLMELPIGVFAIAVSTVVYPLISRHAAELRFDDMAADYRKGLRLILLINIPAAAGLWFLGEPIVRTIFEHGRFTHTLEVTLPLMIYALGLPFFSVVSLTTRAFYALRDTRTPVKIALVNFIINVGLSLWLRVPLGVTGLALASTLAVIVQTFMLQMALTRRLPGMTFSPLHGALVRIGAATVAMSALVVGAWFALSGAIVAQKTASLVGVIVIIPAAAGFYGLLLWLLKIEGREEFAEVVRKFRGKVRS